MLQRCMDTYKMNGKLLVGIKVYENITIHKVYVFIHKTGNYSNGINKSINKCHYLHTQNKYILALIKLSQPETLFVLKQCQINQRIKSNKPKNCESTSFENQKQMYGSIQKRINKVNTYHYPTTTTCKRNES